LDAQIKDFQDQYIAGTQEIKRHCPHAPYLDCEQDMQKVLSYLREKIFPQLKLEEFFLLSID